MSFILDDGRDNPPKIINSEGKIVPSFFMDFDESKVLVYGKSDNESRYKCPHDGTDKDTIELETSKGIFLYCFECGIFYPEFGNWGYK